MHGPINVEWLYSYALFKGFGICCLQMIYFGFSRSVVKMLRDRKLY